MSNPNSPKSFTAVDQADNPAHWIEFMHAWAALPTIQAQRAHLISQLALTKDSKLLIETYPNPCEDYIWLKQSTSQSYQWRLFDIVGNVVKQGRSQLVDERLDMIGLSSGLYVLKVQNSQGAFIKQIQKN